MHGNQFLLVPNPYLSQPPCSGFTTPALGKHYKAPSRMGNIEGVLREISEAVTAARALMGNCYPSMGRQLSETSALLVLQKHTKEDSPEQPGSKWVCKPVL